MTSGRTSTGGIIEREAVVRRQPHRELQQAQLQQRADAGEEVEPRAGHLGAALHVDQAQRLTEFEVILRVRRSPAGSPTVSSTTKSSSPPAGTPSMMTLEIAMCAAVKAFSASRLVGFGGLDLLGEFLGPLEQRGPLLRATPRRPACWRPSARRAGCRRPRPRRAGPRRPRAARRPVRDLRRGRAATRARRRGFRAAA